MLRELQYLSQKKKKDISIFYILHPSKIKKKKKANIFQTQKKSKSDDSTLDSCTLQNTVFRTEV